MYSNYNQSMESVVFLSENVPFDKNYCQKVGKVTRRKIW